MIFMAMAFSTYQPIIGRRWTSSYTSYKLIACFGNQGNLGEMTHSHFMIYPENAPTIQNFRGSDKVTMVTTPLVLMGLCHQFQVIIKSAFLLMKFDDTSHLLLV